jgi:hypothetical protein
MERQTQIIRQSSLTRSLEFFKLNEMTPSLTDVVLAADVLTEWVETGSIKRVRELDKHYLFDSILEKIK